MAGGPSGSSASTGSRRPALTATATRRQWRRRPPVQPVIEPAAAQIDVTMNVYTEVSDAKTLQALKRLFGAGIPGLLAEPGLGIEDGGQGPVGGRSLGRQHADLPGE
jgi:hypothetical protein